MKTANVSTQLQPGDRAPAFRLPTDDSGEISGARLKGQPFVLYFYPKDDTSGCTERGDRIFGGDQKIRVPGRCGHRRVKG